MDMIEYSIACLGFQARAIAEVVPNTRATKDLLEQASGLLIQAARARHDWRNGHTQLAEADRHLRDLPFDDTREAQAQQIAAVERSLAEQGIRVAINSQPLTRGSQR